MQVVGVEAGGFTRQSSNFSSQRTLLVCVLFDGLRLSDCLIGKITVDGLDAMEKLATLLKGTMFEAVMLAGVSFAGFNLVDPKALFDKFSKPVVVVSRSKPNNIAVKTALMKHFKDWKVRWKIFEKLGPVYEVLSKPAERPFYVEVVGAEVEWARKLVSALAVCSRVPEPLRVARLIARGLKERSGTL